MPYTYIENGGVDEHKLIEMTFMLIKIFLDNHNLCWYFNVFAIFFIEKAILDYSVKNDGIRLKFINAPYDVG